jgi:SAM-dependent methyltransferase
MNCRHCDKELVNTFIDLGSSPPSNAYLKREAINFTEKYYPLKVLVCHDCWLVQTEDFVGASEMFSEDYAYYSSYSSTWLDHAKKYVNLVISKFNLDSSSNVIEVAANDGYLLQYFKSKNISCFGIEPTSGPASVAREKGIEVIEDFFGASLANLLTSEGRSADLILANNVLAHVPDINDFVKGFSILLKPQGVATFEFPHLLNLIKFNQFDTIYHEHYSYFSFIAVQSIFNFNGLSIFEVQELTTHGGSLRIFVQHIETGKQHISPSVSNLINKETHIGVNTLNYYKDFQFKVEKVKSDFLNFLNQAKKNGKKIVGYGAAAKGNTLMNFADIHNDLIDFIVDKNPVKQGKYMPGSRIPIMAEKLIKEVRPDYVVILPWNLKKEVIQQLNYIRQWGGQFVIPIPELEIL